MELGEEQGAPILAAPPPVLAHVFSFLSGRDCAAAACACRAFRSVLDSEPHVWALCCSADFGLTPADVTQEAQELQQRGGGRRTGSGASSCPPEFHGSSSPRADQGTRQHSGTPSSGGARDDARYQEGGADVMSAKAVYRKHYLCLRRYGSSYKRALRVWTKLLGWLQANIPALATSILPGVSDAQMDFVERSLGVVLPPALRALYSLHNGQLTAFDAMVGASEDAASTGLRSPAMSARGGAPRRGRGAGDGEGRARAGAGEEWSMSHSRFHGLLGGYAFYDHAVSTRLLPLQLIVLWTLRIRAFLSRRRRQEGRGEGGEGAAEEEEEEDEEEEREGGEGAGAEDEGAGRGQGGRGGAGSEWESRVLIAASFVKVLNGFHFTKMFFLDCSDGMVYVGGSDALAGGALLCCTPPLSHFSRARSGTGQAQAQAPEGAPGPCHSPRPEVGSEPQGARGTLDGAPGASQSADSGLLRWLEEYASRLESGMYRVRELQEDGPFKGICLFPETFPGCSQAVTRGVCVRASAVFVPEATPLGPPLPPRLPGAAQGAHSDEPGEQSQGPPRPAFPSCFAYSIRMRLLRADQTPPTLAPASGAQEPSSLTPAQSSEARGFRQCQLRRRHWLIEEGGEQVAEVRGEAVVGKHPLLREGADEFVYQSCTQISAASGAIQGDFTFVPGSLMHPEGPEFEAAVARFPIQMPEYIF